jgi:hypothetical protein
MSDVEKLIRQLHANSALKTDKMGVRDEKFTEKEMDFFSYNMNEIECSMTWNKVIQYLLQCFIKNIFCQPSCVRRGVATRPKREAKRLDKPVALAAVMKYFANMNII